MITPRRLPEDFLLGCATAAHQVEGGTTNDWTEWEHGAGNVSDGSTSGLACDQWNRYENDIAQMAQCGMNAYRFSLEWSRIEPVEGQFEMDALDHYRDVIASCRAHGLEPIVTLHHFTFPQWVAAKGGLTWNQLPYAFARFAALATEKLGSHVTWWVTVNEPVILAALGYMGSYWPPAAGSPMAGLAALRGGLLMHAAGSRAIHRVAEEHGWRVRVSVAHHERRLVPASSSILDRVAAISPDFLLNRWFLRSVRAGRILPPVGRGERVPYLAGSLDYLGLNWYTNERVVFAPGNMAMLGVRGVIDTSVPQSDYGWAIRPAELTSVIEDLWRTFGWEIMITENGVADSHDELRAQFLLDHLDAVALAMERGVPIRGYLHWSSLDNWEWAEGYARHFGLWEVDRQTQERRAKPSVEVFEQICKTRTLDRRFLDLPPSAHAC